MKKLLLAVALFVTPATALQLPTGTISGQILSREGQPASGIRVSARAVPDAGAPANSATSLVSIAMTDAMGRYRLDNIPPGRYYVIAGLVDLPTYYPGVSSSSAATALNVLSGTPITGINFTMVIPAGVTLSGKVLLPSGQPPTGVQRVALFGGTTPTQDATIRPDGSFEFSRVRPGTYQLAVSLTSMLPTTVVVSDKDITGIQLQVIPTVQISGAVNVANNGLRPRLALTFSPLKGVGNVPAPTLDPNGAFRFYLQEGEYRIGWSQLPVGYTIASITAGSVDLLASTLKVSTASPVPAIAVNLGIDAIPPWVKVSGRVNSLPTARPGTAFRLVLSGSSASAALEPLDVPINPNGSFEFPRLLPGTYSARINPPLPVPVTSFTVSNRDIADLIIAVPPLKEVRGVITQQGTVQPRIVTLAWSVGGNTGNTSMSASVQTDGSFSVIVPEGERRVTASTAGYSIQTFTYGSIDLLRDPLRVSSSDTSEFRITATQTVVGGVVGGVGGGLGGLLPPPPMGGPGGPGGVVGGVVGGVPGGVGGGVPGGVLGGIIAPPPPPPITASPPPPPRQSLQIAPEVAQANLTFSVTPTYSPLARSARVEGVVTLRVEISAAGTVEDIRVMSGHALLNQTAIDAVRQWRYKPYVVNGQAIPVVTTVTVNFALQ